MERAHAHFARQAQAIFGDGDGGQDHANRNQHYN
jgi:hypothetical protein